MEGLVEEDRLGEVGGVPIKLPSGAQFVSDCLHTNGVTGCLCSDVVGRAKILGDFRHDDF